MKLPVAKFGRLRQNEEEPAVKKFWEQDTQKLPISATRAIINSLRGQ